MIKRAIFCMIVISFLFLGIIPADADSSSLYRKAGTVQPVQNNNVRMVEEKVDIQVYGGCSVVRCEFVFKNESDEMQNILMGFPGSLIGEGMDIDETTRLRDFKVYDNGIELEAKQEKASEDSTEMGVIAEWYTWDVCFQAGEERKIINTYKTQNYNAPWGRHTGYILKTGAPWKETIGRAVITFELMDIAPSNIYEENTFPKGYRVDKNKIIWEMKDFEPSEDINLELSGYWPIYDILYGQNEEQRENAAKQIEQAKMLIINGNEEEGLNQSRLLLQQGIYAEELYFFLLNHYHKQGNIDEFIRILKEQIQQLNSPNVLEWSRALYPERIMAEGITYPEEHKPVIRNQVIKKLSEAQFELSAELYDEAGDMTFLSSNVYANGLTMDSLLNNEGTDIVFGHKSYNYKARGKLPEPYSDLTWRLEISDYKGDTEFGMTLDNDRLGESCYFYDGSIFKPWNVKKDNLFTLCYYDKSFDSMEGEFQSLLARRIGSMVARLDMKIPPKSFIINLYDKEHMPRLKKDAPQNITVYLKNTEYRAKLHNDSVAGKSQKEAEEWDWGEIIIELDVNNKDKMIERILQKILADKIGSKWQDAKPEIASAFIAALTGESVTGLFSGMTKEELKKAAQDIGASGKAGSYAKPNINSIVSIIAIMLIGGIVYATYIRNRK